MELSEKHLSLHTVLWGMVAVGVRMVVFVCGCGSCILYMMAMVAAMDAPSSS